MQLKELIGFLKNYGLAVWDAPNVRITKLKLLDSRYAILFKYEWGMQMSLLDNSHGQEK
jgi:hypothetical protein